MITSKTCTKCNLNKSIEYFSIRNSKKGWYKSWCKQCICESKGKKFRGLNTTCKPIISIEVGDLKYCTKCKETKNIELFGFQYKKRNKRKSYCKKCESFLLKEKTYNINLEEYKNALIKLDNCCEICKKPNENGRDLYIDHCHKTNKIRGFLCNNCNTGLGKFKDSIELLNLAIDYLKKP